MLVLLYYILVVTILLLSSIIDFNYNKNIVEFLLILNGVSIFVFLLRKEKYVFLKKQYLKHSYFILIGFVIVYFQFPLDLVLGYQNEYDGSIFVHNSLIVPNLVIASMGLHAFLIGYVIRDYKKSAYLDRIVMGKKNLVIIPTYLIDFLAFVMFLGYFATVNPLYLLGAYGQVEMGTVAGYFSVGLTLFLTASLIQQGLNMEVRFQSKNFTKFLFSLSKTSLVMLCIYLLSVLISGDRGPLIYFALLTFAMYVFVTKVRVKLVLVFGLVFTAALFITILGIIRSPDVDGTLKEKVEFALNKKNDNVSISHNTRELAKSYQILSIGLQDIPDKYDYGYGVFQLKMIITSVPGLYYLVEELVNNREFSEFKTSAELYTWLYFGNFPRYGLGTSSLGDLYADFGVFGVFFGMLFLGVIIRYFEILLFGNGTNSLFLFLFSIIYLCGAIYMARSALLLNISIVVKVYIILFMNRKLLSK